MTDLLVVLNRIADALERFAPQQNVRDFQADQRKWMRFRLDLEARFPGLVQRVEAIPYVGHEVLEALLELEDGPAVLNHIAKDITALKRICAEEPDVLRSELKKVSQRLAIKSVSAEG